MPNLGLPPARLEIVKIITFLIKKLPNLGLPPAKLEIVKIITFLIKKLLNSGLDGGVPIWRAPRRRIATWRLIGGK